MGILSKWFRRKKKSAESMRRRQGRVALGRSRPVLEELEPRRLLATLELTPGSPGNSGSLLYTAAAANDLTILISGSNYVIVDAFNDPISVGPIAAQAGWQGSGTNEVFGPLASLSNVFVNVNLFPADSFVTIDSSLLPIATQPRLFVTGSNAATNTVFGPNTNTFWGVYNTVATLHNAAATNFVSLSNFEHLIGGTAVDSFFLRDTLAGKTLDGGAGSNFVVVDNSLANSLVITGLGSTQGFQGELPGGDTFDNIGNVNHYNDPSLPPGTLVGPNGPTTWSILASSLKESSNNTLTFGGRSLSFSGFSNLVGGSSTDTFSFLGGIVSGNIDGGVGQNTLDYSSLLPTKTTSNEVLASVTGPGAFEGMQGTASFIGGTFNDITNLVGSSNPLNTLTGPNQATTWTMLSAQPGVTSYGILTAGSQSMQFSAMDNLTGGSATDTFSLASGNVAVPSINGGGGTNTLVGPTDTGVVTVVSLGTWDITTHNAGSLNWLALTVGGPNPITTAQTQNFNNIENLTGGVPPDDFVFSDQAAVDGTIDGGPGGNILDYRAYTTAVSAKPPAGTATGTGGIANIQAVVGAHGPVATGVFQDLTAVRNSDGTPALFALDAANRLWYQPSNAFGQWQGWTELGGFVRALSVGTNANGTLEVFAVGLDNALYTLTQTSPSGAFTPNAFTDLGGAVISLSVAANQNGTLEGFVIGTDNALHTVTQTAPNGSFTAGSFTDLGGFVKTVRVGTNQNGTLQAFAIGFDNALYTIVQTSPNGAFTPNGFTDLGGFVASISVAANQNGDLQVLAVGSDNSLHTIGQTSPNGPFTAGAFSNLGGFVSSVSVGLNQNGDLEAFAFGSDHQLYTITQTSPGGTFGSFVGLGGYIQKTTTGFDNLGDIEVFALGSDGQVYYRATNQSGNFTQWIAPA